MCFYFSSTNRKTLFVILFCILNGAGIVVSAQEIPQQGSFVTRATQDRKLSAASYVPPSKKGELSCYQANSTPAKEICTYLPINELAGSLKARILRAYFGSRQPSNPDEAYISVSQDQLEFAFTDQALMQEIKAIIPRLDTLDTYVVRRKVNIVVEILQLMEGADDSAGFLIGAQYTGNSSKKVVEHDRIVTSTAGGIINFNFGFGNLVNTLLDFTLRNYISTRDVKVISSVPLTLTHGYQLANVIPYTKTNYVQTTSVSSVPEQEGIRFEGQSRFYQNEASKITIKDFVISVSQFEPSATKREGIVEGVETFKSPVRDLELEIGCSTAIRVINVSRKVKQKEKNLFFSSKDEYKDSQKVFLFVIKAVSDSIGSPASTHCDHTGAVP